MTDFHDVVAFSWELDWTSLCGHRPAGEKCSWKEFYSLWPWAGSQGVRFTLSIHAFRCISLFPIKPADSSTQYGSISRLPTKRALLCRCEEGPVKKQAVTCSWTVRVRAVAYTARLGQQLSTLSFNATCQVLISCLGIVYTCPVCVSNPTRSEGQRPAYQRLHFSCDVSWSWAVLVLSVCSFMMCATVLFLQKVIRAS